MLKLTKVKFLTVDITQTNSENQYEEKKMRKVISKVYKIPIPEKSQPYNFDFFLTHYVFAPWVVEGKELVRLFKLESGKFVLVKVGFKKTPKPVLLIKLLAKKILIKEEQNNLVELISWIFAVNDDVKYFYKVICQKDPVLKAASTEIYGAHLRADPYVLESVIGVIVAQNVYFKRIYEMQRLLCEKFGEKQVFDRTTYYTFPTAQILANAKLSDIRACKVGYRDKYIKGVAEKLVKEKIDLDNLRKLSDLGRIRQKLIELPGSDHIPQIWRLQSDLDSPPSTWTYLPAKLYISFILTTKKFPMKNLKVLPKKPLWNLSPASPRWLGQTAAENQTLPTRFAGFWASRA